MRELSSLFYNVFRIRMRTAIKASPIAGSYFLFHSIRYVANPTPPMAMKNVFASPVQLGLLVLGALVGAVTGI